MNNNIKLLLIGFGYWGKIWYKTIKNSQYDLVGIVDPIFISETLNDESLHLYKDLQYVDIDFTHAIIATPAQYHLHIYKRLKELYKVSDNNILIEKPVGVSLKEASEMKFCHHGFVWLYDECVKTIKELKNSIGNIYLYKSIRASMGPRIRTDVSILEDYLFHDLYIYFNIFDGYNNTNTLKIKEVKFSKYFNSPIKASEIDLKLENDLFLKNIEMFSSWHWPIKERKIILLGSLGSIIWENDKIFINKTHYERKDDNFIDGYGNKGYELKTFPILEIEDIVTDHKTNLEKQLDNFVKSEKSNTTDLLMNTWALIDNIYNNS